MDNGDSNNPETSAEGGKKGSGKKKNQKKKKSSNQRKNNSKKSQSGQDLTTKVYNTMEKHKEVFFTIRLHSAQSGASLGPIGKFDLPSNFISSEAMRRHSASGADSNSLWKARLKQSIFFMNHLVMNIFGPTQYKILMFP